MNHSIPRKSVLAALIVSATVVACSLQASTDQAAAAVRYESPGRTAYYIFSGGAGEFGRIQPLKPTEEQSREFYESLGKPIYDCSDSGHRCLRTWFSVFAVPKQKLAPGMTYTVEGVHLRVEECLRASQQVCQIALISADCQSIVGLDACEPFPGGRAKSPEPGPITYFIYNEDYGVTAFGVAGEWPKSSEDRLDVATRVATQHVLQGDAGLLKAVVTTVLQPARK